MTFIRRYVLASAPVVVSFSLLASGQAPPAPVPLAPTPALATTAFAGEPLVIERSSTIYSFEPDGTGWRERSIVVKVQTDAALRVLGVIAVPFASASERVEFHFVRARHPDGKVSETPVSGVIEQPEEVTRQAPFYSDLKQAQLPVKDLRVGDTIEWEARIVRTKAEAPGHFWGADSFVTEGSIARNQTLELRGPAAATVTVWTNPELGIKPVEETRDGKHLWRWSYEALKPTFGPAADAEKAAKKGKPLKGDEKTDAELGKLPSIAWTTFQSWAEVGAWYRGLVGARAQPDDEVRAQAAQLTAGKTTDEAKVRALYAYVSASIRYIGVAFGVGRYQPHEAADVLHNQYGDCKDKALLLTSLLSAAGIPSDSALIGAEVRFNAAVPSPAAFNHMITHLTLHGEDVWLDATEEVAPYRMMVPVLRDKSSLVVPDKGVAHIETTPKTPPFAFSDVWMAKGKLDEKGTVNTHIDIRLRGDDELVLRSVTREVSPSQYDELMKRLVASFGYSGTTSHAVFSSPTETADPFEMSFDYNREKPGDDWENLRILPQLEPDGLPIANEKDPPVVPLSLDAPRTITSQSIIELPHGWTAELPEATHQNSPWATYDRTYSFANGTVTVDKKLVVLQEKVPAEDWKAYKKWTDAAGVDNDSFIQLRRSGTVPRAGGPATTPATDDAVRSLLAKAQEQYMLGEPKALETTLKEAKALNPNAPRLNAWYGSLELLRNNTAKAIAYNRKELELYPDEYDRYEAIAFIQSRAKNDADAEETLREWSKIDSGNPYPLVLLTETLLREEKPAAAETAGQQALAETPEDSKYGERLRLALGTAQVKAGDTAKGGSTLVALLKATDDVYMLNNAAYVLAEAKLELAAAETAERTALEKLDTETRSWTMDEDPATLRAKTSLLFASWDTMGWIYFREGKLKEAKTFLEASWKNRPQATEREHLDALRDASPTMPKTELNPQQARTISLGPAGGRKGVAEYALLVEHGSVVRVQRTGDKTVDGGDALLRAADFTELFPEGSKARLYKPGMLNCLGSSCTFVLLP